MLARHQINPIALMMRIRLVEKPTSADLARLKSSVDERTDYRLTR